MIFADRAPVETRGWLHYKLLEYLGTQEGHALGTESAQATLDHPFNCWIYDRKTGLILELNHAHSFVASLLFNLHNVLPEYNTGAGDDYVEQHMGFFLSSVSRHTRSIHVAPGYTLSAQERAAFRNYIFKAWS